MTPEVSEAIDELHAAFPGHRIEVDPEDQGGAYVVIHDVLFGEQFEPSRSWLGFLITFQYPEADVYPLFTVHDLKRIDGQALGQAFQQVSWRDKPATQISRRSNRLDPAEDTALLKVLKVLDFMRHL